MTLIDAFAGTDATVLTSHTPDAGGSWTNHASWSGSGATIRTNRAAPGTSESVVYHSGSIVDRATTSYSFSAALKYVASNTSSYGGLWAGVTGAKTGYVVYWYAGEWSLGKYVAGAWTALGSYTSSLSVGDNPTIALAVTSSQVKLLLNGVAVITANDTAITPTRIGIYGVTSDPTKGFHLDDLTYLPPTDGSATVAVSGTNSGVVCGTDKYGQITMVAQHTPGSVPGDGATIERSADGGSTWAAVSSGVTVTSLGSNAYKIVDARPVRGSQPQTAYGSGSVKYRATITSGGAPGVVSSASSAVTATLDSLAVIQKQAENAHTYISGKSGGYVPISEVLQPGQWLMASVFSFYYATIYGWSGASGYLTDAQNQWTYIKGLRDGTGIFNLGTAGVNWEVDAALRPISHALRCAILLRATGNSTAATLAADISSVCDTSAKAVIDNCPLVTSSYAGWDADSQPAVQRSHAYAVGDLVRPTTPNGRSYRCKTAGTTASGAVTLTASDGAEITDGSVVWKETTRANAIFAYAYYAATSTATSTEYYPNKQAVGAEAMALLMNDSACTHFYTGGSYRTTAQAIVDATIDTLCSSWTNADGSMPYSNVSGYLTKDTLYGGFVTSTLASVKKLGYTSNWMLDAMLAKALDWLETGNYSTEPLSVTHLASIGPDIGPGGDIALRAAAYKVLVRTNPVADLIYTAAFNDPATGNPTYYAQYGGASPFADKYLEDIFDGLTQEAAITGAVIDTATRGAVTFAGRGAGSTQTDTALRGSATFNGRAAANTQTHTAGDTWGWADTITGGPTRARTSADSWAWSDAAGPAAAATDATAVERRHRATRRPRRGGEW